MKFEEAVSNMKELQELTSEKFEMFLASNEKMRIDIERVRELNA